MAIPGQNIATGAIESALAPLEAIGGAATALTGVFGTLIGQIQELVGAVAPGVVQALMFSFRELQATLGQLLVPVAQVLSEVFRDVAANLDPVIKSLVPIISKLAQLMGSQIAVIADVIAMIVDSFLPIIEALVSAMEPWIGLLKIIAVALGTFNQLLKPLREFFAETVLKPFVDILKEAVKMLILFTVALAKALGANKFVDKLYENLTKDKAPLTANAAPLNPAIKTLDQIMKDIQTASFAAGGAAPLQKTQDEWMQSIVQGIDEINKGRLGLHDVIVAALRKFFPELGNFLAPDEAHRPGQGESAFKYGMRRTAEFVWDNWRWIPH